MVRFTRQLQITELFKSVSLAFKVSKSPCEFGTKLSFSANCILGNTVVFSHGLAAWKSAQVFLQHLRLAEAQLGFKSPH